MGHMFAHERAPEPRPPTRVSAISAAPSVFGAALSPAASGPRKLPSGCSMASYSSPDAHIRASASWGGTVVSIRTGVPGMTETKVEAARIRWHEHQTEHGCTSLTCAEAQLKYQE